MMKRHVNIPIFIPHLGCPNQCVFCNQRTISGISKFEISLWTLSSFAVVLSFVLTDEKNWLTLISSLVGVTALIFVAKGLAFGHLLCLIFAVVYGIVSIKLRYYSEVITYLGMSAPAALFSLVSWVRNPYKDSAVVEVSRMTKSKFLLSLGFTAVVTVAFYFILKALNTSELIVSTVSILTSCLASVFSFLRSPYYALAYVANDIVLIVLWSIALFTSIAYLPMVVCFVAFLANDTYGFFNWRLMGKSQGNEN